MHLGRQLGFRAADIDTLNVHLAATQGFMVRACASYWNTSGGTCGTSDTVDTNGLAQPGLTAWDRTGDFMYVAVDGYQAIQSVRGIYAYIN